MKAKTVYMTEKDFDAIDVMCDTYNNLAESCGNEENAQAMFKEIQIVQKFLLKFLKR